MLYQPQYLQFLCCPSQVHSAVRNMVQTLPASLLALGLGHLASSLNLGDQVEQKNQGSDPCLVCFTRVM